MTPLEHLISLDEAIQKALAATRNGPTPDVRRYMRTHYREVIEANALTIEDKGLDAMIRDERKTGANRSKRQCNGNMGQICLDLGLERRPLLDEQISLPADPDDVAYGRCTWIESEDASIDDADLHVILLDALTASTSGKADDWRTLRKHAARIVPLRTDIPFRILAAIARRQITLQRKLTPDEVQCFWDEVAKKENARKAKLTEDQIKDGAAWKLSREEMDRIPLR